MKHILTLIISLIITTCINAQDFYKYGSFVLKGKVENAKEPLIDFSITSFMGQEIQTLVLKNDGSFEQSFSVQHFQDIFLNRDEYALGFSVKVGDTITMNWDDKNFINSFVISGSNQLRTNDLAIQSKILRDSISGIRSFFEQLDKRNSKLTLSKKYDLINTAYNDKVDSILSLNNGFINENLGFFITSLYFRYSSLLERANLLPLKLELKPPLDSSRNITYSIIPGNKLPYGYDYNTLNYEWFINVPEYRDFLFDQVRFFEMKKSRPLTNYKFSDDNKPTLNEITFTATKETNDDLSNYVLKDYNSENDDLSNYVLKDYNSGNKYLDFVEVKEWFQVSIIFFGFKYYNFKDAEKVLEKFNTSVKSSYLKDTLQQYYIAMKRLAPGSPAPAFSLKNDKGKIVKLSDYKGKVVYIDFWGAGCGPCISEIKNYTPELHKKFAAKDVVFLNISVEEDGWKNAIIKYNVEGINLVADGWYKNKVCNDYNIGGIPHYILIDKNGNIADNNAQRPSEMLESFKLPPEALQHTKHKENIETLLK
jgi:peroxiredoxin